MLFHKRFRSNSFLKATVCTILLAAMSISVSGCYFLPKEEEVLAPPIKEPEKIVYETVEAKKGTIINDIKCSGNFVSTSKMDLYYKDRGGRVKKIYVKNGDEVKKGQLLAELETEGIETSIKLQKITLRKSEINYDRIKLQNSIEGTGKDDLEIAALDVDANKIQLDSLLNELEKSKMVSTIDGKVVYVNEIKLGEYIDAYTTVVRVANPDDIQLEYSGDKTTSFSLGTAVEVSINKVLYAGTVTATPANVPADADENAKKAVRIKVNGIADKAKMGDTAEIRLELEKHENVIVIQNSLINTFNGRKFVNVLKDGVREECDVETGIKNSTEVEIVKGLKGGEMIISR